MIRLSKIAFTSAFLVAAIVLIAVPRAEAKTFKLEGSFSGTSVSVPVDLDGNGTTCPTVGGVKTCPDDSTAQTIVGKATGKFGGPEVTQGVSENVPVSGTGCFFAPSTIQSCTLGAVTNACEFQFLAGVSGVTIITSTNSVLPDIITGGTLCLDVSSGLPFNFAATITTSISGGTGNFEGVTGSGSIRFTGQETSVDPAGHGFLWLTGTFTDTLTK